jgi:hypothetical protein
LPGSSTEKSLFPVGLGVEISLVLERLITVSRPLSFPDVSRIGCADGSSARLDEQDVHDSDFLAVFS